MEITATVLMSTLLLGQGSQNGLYSQKVGVGEVRKEKGNIMEEIS